MIYEYKGKHKAWFALVIVALFTYLCVMSKGAPRFTEYLVGSILISVVLSAAIFHDAFKIRQVRTDENALTVERSYQDDLVYPWPQLIAMYRQRKFRTPSQLFLRRTDQSEWEMVGLVMHRLPEHEALIREIKNHIGDRWEVDPDYDERQPYL